MTNVTARTAPAGQAVAVPELLRPISATAKLDANYERIIVVPAAQPYWPTPALIFPSFISVAASGFVAWLVWRGGRRQDRIETALDLHKDYYSPEMGEARRKAERFLYANRHADWLAIDPYELDDPEGLRSGYSEVVRFWHRLSVVDKAMRADPNLIRDLFSRELGGWFALGLHAMRVRKGWWTGPMIRALALRLGTRGGGPLLDAGYKDEASRIMGRQPSLEDEYDLPWRAAERQQSWLRRRPTGETADQR